MHKLKIHTADGYNKVLGSMLHGEHELEWGHVDIYHKDGNLYRSNMAKAKQNAIPSGTTFVDDYGNIALYVTSIIVSGEAERDLIVQHEGQCMITYFPADVINRMVITWKKQ